jgi:hypothetical protein
MQTHKQIHLESLNLTLDSQPSKGDEWEGVCSAQEDVKMIRMPREVPKSRPPTIYKFLKQIKLLAPSQCLFRTDRTCWYIVTGRATPASGRSDLATCQRFELRSVDRNGRKWSAPQVRQCPDAPLRMTRLWTNQRQVKSSKLPKRWKHDRTCQVKADLTRLSVRSRHGRC